MSWTPEATCEAARFTACCAEPHCRSIVVAEVSSFQLETIETFQPRVAAVRKSSDRSCRLR